MVLEELMTTQCPECGFSNAECRFIGAYMQSSPLFVLYCTNCKRRVRTASPEQVVAALNDAAIRRMRKQRG